MGLTAAQLTQNTLQAKLGMWAANLRENYDVIRKSRDITDLPPRPGPALCLGNGPSLPLHLDEIRRFKGTVFSCERNLIPVLEHGVVPEYVCSIDGDPILAQFVDHPLVRDHKGEMVGLFSTTVSPDIVKLWPGEIVFFNSWIDNFEEYKSVSLVFQELTNKTTMHNGGTCGSALWYAAMTLDCNPMVLIGIDYAYHGIGFLDETQIWKMVCHLPEKQILDYYCRYTNSFGNNVITDAAWDCLSGALASWLNLIKDHTTFQCSDYTIIDQPPLICIPFKDYLAQQGVAGDQVTVLRPEVVKVGGDEQ